MEELVSIVVPVYRAADYIADTIASVQRQTYRNWELLLVDDHSPDESVSIIRECLGLQQEIDRAANTAADITEIETDRVAGTDCAYTVEADITDRFRLICLKENGGAARARNTGVSQARGRYLAFLDADDIWQPEKLEKELSFLREKKAAFVFTAYEFGDADGHGTGKIVSVPETLSYHQALTRTVIFTSTVLFDRTKIDAALLEMPTVASEDTATWWQILRAGHTAYGFNEALVLYRRPAHTLSSNKVSALQRIWGLYRREGISVVRSAWYFCFWALRASLRRL